MEPQSQFSVHGKRSRIEGNRCFNCDKEGHWSRDCPYKSPSKKPILTDDPCFPHLQCPCGAGNCIIRTSKTARNPDRKFYSCPAKSVRKCDFFRWCDAVTVNGAIKFSLSPPFHRSPPSPPSPLSPTSPLPQCPCGAGVCSMLTEDFGPNAGRNFFVCPVKKGQGACNFFLWENTGTGDAQDNNIDEMKQFSTHQSLSTGQQDYETGKTVSGKEGTLNSLHLERMENLPVTKNPPPNIGTVLVPSKKENVLLMENWKSEFLALKLYNAAQTASLEDFIRQILRLNVLGWLGRLAFPPPRHLTVPPPKPFFCCVFPSYDLILVPPNVDECDVEFSSNLSRTSSDLLLLSPAQDAELLDGVLLEQSELKSPPEILQGTTMSGSILEAFGQAALQVQNKLVTLLESMNPLDYDSMVREANSAFAGLDCLGIDYRPFYERVRNFIGHASRLAQIESAICNDISSQKLIDSYKSKKSHYDNISGAHAQAMTAFTFSNQRLHFLREEAIRVKKMLLQMETQVACCEVETLVLDTCSVQISADMFESNRNLQVAYNEAARAMQLRQQREAERSAAKEALKRARIQLRT